MTTSALKAGKRLKQFSTRGEELQWILYQLATYTLVYATLVESDCITIWQLDHIRPRLHLEHARRKGLRNQKVASLIPLSESYSSTKGYELSSGLLSGHCWV